MDKEEIKKHCDAIEELLEGCVDTYLDQEDLEDVREHLRALRGEAPVKRVILTTNQRKLIDLISEDYELDHVYMETEQGWVFLATPENVRLFKQTILKELDGLISKITRVVEE